MLIIRHVQAAVVDVPDVSKMWIRLDLSFHLHNALEGSCIQNLAAMRFKSAKSGMARLH